MDKKIHKRFINYLQLIRIFGKIRKEIYVYKQNDSRFRH
jgi:hypothetical protein